MKKLEETKALLSKKYPQGVPFEMLFEVLLDEYLDKHSPKRKNQRREKRLAKQSKLQSECSNKIKQNNVIIRRTKQNKRGNSDNKLSRHIPSAIYDQVFARDGGRCTFIGSNGRRCNQTWDLEIDHVKPFAKDGRHNLKNLRLLCANHNQYEAERVYGKRFMEQQRCKATPMRK